MIARARPNNVIAMPQKSNEWYTPACYIEAARHVMGGIDLDPASCALANETVKATRFYTKEDDGLSKSWYGRVWLNPPYGKAISYTSRGRYMGGGNTQPKSLQTQFVEKAVREYKAGHVQQIVLLVTANISLRWFQPLWEYPLCTPFPKIRFIVPGRVEGQRQVFGNVFVYLGPHEQQFIDIFSQFGRIAKAIDTPRQSIQPPSLWEVHE